MWTPKLGRRVGIARGVLETAASESRTLWTPDLGQVVGTAPGFLVTAPARAGSWPGAGVFFFLLAVGGGVDYGPAV